ncbi:MAG: helix-turn-helix domain-containing protein [Clostridia bacterium]|nr:helix-turn-helix domain-containing protein [Clostridia bacterium]
MRTEFNINIYNGCREELKFVYCKNVDKPENHFMHINKYCEIYVFVDGDANYIVEDMIFSLKKGDIVIITPYEVHKAVLQKKGNYERFYFLIPIDAFSYMTVDPLKKILEQIKIYHNLLSLPSKEREEMINLLYEMKKLAENKPTSDLQMYSCFLKFIDIIMQNLGTAEDDVVTKNSQQFPQILSDVLRYIDDNLTDIRTAEEIAQHFHISLPYLSSMFKSYINIGIKKYIQLRKISYAKSLLDNGRNVTEACFESGFNSCSYFIKTFKEHIGTTPFAYVSDKKPDR